ncbi:MAG: hypothetical protein IPN58_17315 [Anaerolineales bacterium]|nr:hypothetical protein [Anaerolineales bacterium]
MAARTLGVGRHLLERLALPAEERRRRLDHLDRPPWPERGDVAHLRILSLDARRLLVGALARKVQQHLRPDRSFRDEHAMVNDRGRETEVLGDVVDGLFSTRLQTNGWRSSSGRSVITAASSSV